MSRYIMRLDDASEYMDVEKWQRMENLLDKYGIKPIVGVIPNNQDPDMVGVYTKDERFWNKALQWHEKGWSIALHGYTHVFETKDGGINPVNSRSEFAGVPLERQKEKIRLGVAKLKEHGLAPQIFFAPAHTFDENTLAALKQDSDIRVISDTIATDVYYKNGLYFIPQQSGKVRKLPFKTVTFCYHPNMMQENNFAELELFLSECGSWFTHFSDDLLKRREVNAADEIVKWVYFFRRKEK